MKCIVSVEIEHASAPYSTKLFALRAALRLICRFDDVELTLDRTACEAGYFDAPFAAADGFNLNDGRPLSAPLAAALVDAA
jgi:hypothetical protein